MKQPSVQSHMSYNHKHMYNEDSDILIDWINMYIVHVISM